MQNKQNIETRDRDQITHDCRGMWLLLEFLLFLLDLLKVIKSYGK